MSDKSDAAPAVPLQATGALKVGMLRPGTEVLQGRFKVLELLGRGGMGDVYLAEQTSLGRKVALKTLREDMSLQPGMTERFKREARLLSTVDHPSIVRVIDFGEAEGAYVLVMEFVEGENLAAEVRRGPREVPRAVLVMKDIADGLAAIHAQGIIHRDLKPDNVLLTQGPEGEHARLLDFGIARMAEEQGGAAMTQAGLVLGTPEYLAPEQATGGLVDARSDVYAFGVLAYRMLAGRHPFPGPSARDFLLQHITQQPPELASVAPQLAEHGPLLALVMSCLSKEPSQRPDGGKGLVAALCTLEGRTLAVTTRTPAPVAAAPLAPALSPTVPSRQITGAASSSTRARAHALLDRLKWVDRRVLLAVVLALAGVVLVSFVAGAGDSTLARAGKHLDDGQPAAAVELLDASKRRAEPAYRLLKAEALHQTKRHRDEWDLVKAVPVDALDDLRSAALVNLLEDFVKHDHEEVLRSALSRLPRGQLAEVKDLAEGPASTVQWGATRYLDSARVPGADLVAYFVTALESPDCGACAEAARRLGELGDKKAIEPLERLKHSSRKGKVLFFDTSCGQDEATAALQKLNAPAE